MRIDLNLPSLAVTVVTAAAAQGQWPVTDWLPAKIPFLTAVGLYYALTKPWPVAVTALVWAGALTDALGGLPLFCTLSYLLAVYWAVRVMQRVFLDATLSRGMLLVAGAAAGQTLWMRLWAGSYEPLLAWQTLAALGASAQAGLLAGFVVFALCGRMDRLSGMIRPVKENDGILWAETDC